MREIAERFRLAVTVCEKVMLPGRPDIGTVYGRHVNDVVDVPHHVRDAQSARPTVVVRRARLEVTLLEAVIVEEVKLIAHPFERGITRDRAIARGWELTGGQPERIEVVRDGRPLEDRRRSVLETHGEGLYEFA